MKQLSLGNESIAFQSGAFFKDLTLIITDLFANGTKTKEAMAPYFVRIDRCTYEHTGIAISTHLWAGIDNAIICCPAMTRGNVLNGMAFGRWAEKKFDAEKLSFLNIDKKGWVDPLTSRVGGAFSEIVFNCFIGSGFLFSKKYSAEEVAGFIIHEVGHAFNLLQFLADTVIVSSVLQRSYQELTSKNVDATIKITLTRAADDLAMKNRAWIESLDSNDGEVAYRLLVSAAQIEPRAMDNKRFFTQDASEELADIFAARHGAARAIVSARSKDMSSYEGSYGTLVGVGYFAAGALMIPVTAVCGALLIFLGVYLTKNSIALAGNESDITSFKKSATKMRNQCVEQLKQSKLPKEEIGPIIDNLTAIDEMIQNSRESAAVIPAIVRFTDMFRRGKMDARSSREYTDKLEVLVSNDLFVRAAQFA